MDILDLLQNRLVVGAVGVILTLIFVAIIFAFSRRRMANLADAWTALAESHGLKYASNPVAYDYGDFIGEQSWDFPGMIGNYRGREVQVQSTAGTQGREAGRFILIATISLKKNAPFSALAYKHQFSEAIRERIPKDTKTDYKPLDKDFKIRSENTDFLVNLSQSIALAEGLKAQNFRTAQLVFDGTVIAFEGALSGYNVKPEQAIALLDWLCNIADRVDVSR